jgi:hypothetical protein
MIITFELIAITNSTKGLFPAAMNEEEKATDSIEITIQKNAIEGMNAMLKGALIPPYVRDFTR